MTNGKLAGHPGPHLAPVGAVEADQVSVSTVAFGGRTSESS